MQIAWTLQIHAGLWVSPHINCMLLNKSYACFEPDFLFINWKYLTYPARIFVDNYCNSFGSK